MPTIKFYGTRGSAPISGEEYLEYGGATTCLLLQYTNANIMVDCGTGAADAADDLKDVDELHLFLTHPHLDHISGIVSLIPMFHNKKLHIYGRNYNGITVQDNLERIMGLPLWPVGPKDFKGVEYHELEDEIVIDGIKITNMESNHPGGCTLYRFDGEKSSVVTAFDFNHANGFDEKLVKFAKNADVMIYDGMFTPSEYKKKSTWGHSTPETGAEIALKAKVKELYITHHDGRTDDQLSAQEEKLHIKYSFLRFAKCGMHKNKFEKMLEVGTLLTSEKDNNRMFEYIIRAAMDITGADGGTLYLLKDEALEFKIMITKSKNFFRGGKGDHIDLPPVKLSIKNVCAASVIERRIINIPDVYHNDDYDFSGPRNYDKLNGYKTTSALVVPMMNDYDEIIGTIQLINATDELGKVVPFSREDEKIIQAIASQAAISLTNINYSKQVSDLLYGFVKVMSTGIDARTPYNANHTRNMVKYANKFFDYQNSIKGPYVLSDSERREILISIWLHDVGKLITPLEVMDKNTRLGEAIDDVENRFGRIDLLIRLAHAQGKYSEEEFEKTINLVKDDLAFIKEINNAGFLPDDKLERLNGIAEQTYIEIDGEECHALLPEEINKLSIRKGTLTAEERSIMESHVVMTSKMLSELDFPRGYEEVPFLAGSHHEHLNGKGYPNHLTAEELPWKSRFITILDVFEALTAKDRPYKPPMPTEKAMAILDDMVNCGQIDNDILDSFKQSKAWE